MLKETFSDLSEQERQQRIKDLLTENKALRGENFKILSNAIGIISNLDDTLSLAEIAGLLGRFPAATGVAHTLSPLAAVLFPVSSFIAIVNANEAGIRQYGMRGIAYAATAWAFNKPMLDGSRKILANRAKGFPRESEDKRQAAATSWSEASQLTIKRLNSISVTYRTSTTNIRVILRAIGDDNPRTLCLVLLKRFEYELPTIQRHIWRSNYGVLYPD